jgi:hypothetical protein
MHKSHMQHDIRRTRIYKNSYRPTSNPLSFLVTLLSVIFYGHSQVDGSRLRHRD